ncbi:transporter [Chromobacterium violaceum]|uniref:transporter n=1 Tax=Chromobacterium violaceum TaxID=536 RepID=UPI001B31937A|nr:transporter [Chromobacterium violaceum]MBP4044500.1 transporter [Chromobacterium violaceum]
MPPTTLRSTCNSLLLAALSLSFPLQARADISLESLQQQISDLAQTNRQQEQRIRQLEQQLAGLTRHDSQSAAAAIGSHTDISSKSVGADTAANHGAMAGGNGPALPVVSEVPKSMEDIYQEASGFAAGKFSIEPSLTYTHYDTRELVLNGFLALDSIFLGNINLDKVVSDSLTLDLATRYSPSPRWQLDIDLPFVARDATYFSGGAGGAANSVSQGSVQQGPALGDISLGLGYKLVEEDADWPDMVWSLRVKAPTGRNPYGIKLVQSAGNNNLSTPDRLPTGNGVWGITTGLSFVKTADPAVLFASLSYTHYLDGHFRDISPTVGVAQPGDVRLGNSWSWGAGIAFALNDKLSLGLSYSQQMVGQARVRQQGSSWTDVVGSSANAANLNLGLTYAYSKRLSIIPSLSLGMTPDSPNYAFSVKFPYRF